MDNLTIKYFGVRGRCEPILLMLFDSKIPFTTETISLEEWNEMSKEGGAGPPSHPSFSLPVLSFTDSESGEHIVIPETNAILLLLDRYLKSGAFAGIKIAGSGSSGAVEEAVTLARRIAILEMSMFYLNRVFQMTARRDWISGESRKILGKTIAARFLEGLEYQLRLSPEVIPSKNEVLSGPASAAFVAVSFTYDLFPASKGLFTRCSFLYQTIWERPEISKFFLRDGEVRLRVPWTITEYGRIEFINKEAAENGEGDLALFISSNTGKVALI